MRTSITALLATGLSSALAADPVFTFGPASDYLKSPVAIPLALHQSSSILTALRL
jgi:hypothetical protein